MPRVLLIEDDLAFARRLARNLAMDDFEAEVAEGGASGLRMLASGGFDAVLCDLRMPEVDGYEVLRRVRSGQETGIDPRLPILMLTSIHTVEAAVEAMRLGASDFLDKEAGRPEIVMRLRRAIGQRDLVEENDRLRARLAQNDDFAEMVGDSAEMQAIRRDIAEVAATGATVLILGETGVGKELVARAIHRASGRTGEFVDLNSALLPDDTMLQSELFGHERGAFTDARTQRKGKLELADGGTLFFDEVGELPLDTQARLLRVLETMTFTRLGGTKPIRSDCRLVAATNRDLLKLCREGRFREDLYYRLSVFPIEVPPLRRRPADVLPLARHFLARFAARYRRPEPRLDEAAATLIARHEYPGNVRELRNICERLVIRARGNTITADLLRECGIAPPAPASLAATMLPAGGLDLDALERDLVVEALRRTDWNQTEAARLLGITVDRMNNRVKKYGLTHDRWRVHRGEAP